MYNGIMSEIWSVPEGNGITSYILFYTVRELVSLTADKDNSKIFWPNNWFNVWCDTSRLVSYSFTLYKFWWLSHWRFIKFQGIYSHTVITLTLIAIERIRQLDLDIENCAGQSYDNISNIVRKYTVIQARIKELVPGVELLPYVEHFLNLIGVHAVNSCNDAIKYFNIMQSL